jgi:hypothetical protein
MIARTEVNVDFTALDRASEQGPPVFRCHHSVTMTCVLAEACGHDLPQAWGEPIDLHRSALRRSLSPISLQTMFGQPRSAVIAANNFFGGADRNEAGHAE